MDLLAASLFSSLNRRSILDRKMVRCGGPGSGRHSEGNLHPLNKPLHKILLKGGFSYRGTKNGVSTYHHPESGMVEIHPGGDATRTSNKELDKELNKHLAAAERTANYHGEDIPVGKVGFVDKNGDAHLPFNTPGRARNALARVNQTDAVPGSAKQKVLSKIRKAAGHKGVEVSDKPTPSQKKWVKKKTDSENAR